MKQENNSLNIEKFLIIFLSFMYHYDDSEIDINIDDLTEYIKECKKNNNYNSILKIFDQKIEKNIDIEIKSFETKQLLKKINKDSNIYRICDAISEININYKEISSFIEEIMDFVDNYNETYLNDEYEKRNVKNRHY